MTLISRKIPRRRVLTGSRGTPATALRSPSGKRAGSAWRQRDSTARKLNAVATLPATIVVPKGVDEATVRRVMEKSERNCIISSSLKAQSVVDAVVVVG